ncbi:MAG: hypothetical protein JJU29_22795 [Verrucomicrobia bacterium]|nr:hypothetical protein [Verrucomicrobiota bacterium]
MDLDRPVATASGGFSRCSQASFLRQEGFEQGLKPPFGSILASQFRFQDDFDQRLKPPLAKVTNDIPVSP